MAIARTTSPTQPTRCMGASIEHFEISINPVQGEKKEKLPTPCPPRRNVAPRSVFYALHLPRTQNVPIHFDDRQYNFDARGALRKRNRRWCD